MGAKQTYPRSSSKFRAWHHPEGRLWSALGLAGGREGARGVSAICSSANAGLQLAEQDLRRTIGPSFGVSAGADSLCCAARAIVVELSMIIAGAPGPMYAWHGADQVTKVGFLDCWRSAIGVIAEAAVLRGAVIDLGWIPFGSPFAYRITSAYNWSSC